MSQVPNSSLITQEALDDLSSKFMINVPPEERGNLIRMCFQMEQAHWFYLDFYRIETERSCPIKHFAIQLFGHIAFLQHHVPNMDVILENWKKYKQSVPTFGAILLSEDLTKVLLVQSFFTKCSWGFPKGKVNEDEDPVHCAKREVLEETGFDIENRIVPDEYFETIFNDQTTRLYVVCNVPLDTEFVPQTRNEIKACQWFPIECLPTNKTDTECRTKLGINANAFFTVMPFVKKLKKWVQNRLEMNARRARSEAKSQNKRQRHKSMGDIENMGPPGQTASGITGDSQVGPASTSCKTRYNSSQQQQQQPPASSSFKVHPEGKRRDKVNKSNIKRQLFGSDQSVAVEQAAQESSTSFAFVNFPVNPQPKIVGSGAKARNIKYQNHQFAEEEEEETTERTSNVNQKPFEFTPFLEWDNFQFDMERIQQCLAYN